MERSCMCCQESGEREASVSLFCPKAKPGERKFRKVGTSSSLGTLGSWNDNRRALGYGVSTINLFLQNCSAKSQESTFWHTARASHCHVVFVRLGRGVGGNGGTTLSRANSPGRFKISHGATRRTESLRRSCTFSRRLWGAIICWFTARVVSCAATKFRGLLSNRILKLVWNKWFHL